MLSCYDGEYATNQTIKYFTTLQETCATGELENRDPNSSIIIIPDKMLFYLRIDREGLTRGKPYPIFKAKLRKIKRCEVFQIGNARNGIIYIMIVESYS